MSQFEDYGITEQELSDVGSMKKLSKTWDPTTSIIVEECLMHFLPSLSDEILNDTEETND